MKQRTTFWKVLETIRKQIKAEDLAAAKTNILSLMDELHGCEDSVSLRRKELLETFISSYRIDINYIPNFLDSNTDLSTYVRHVTPGVSLVTCARNRSENLVRALPSWLACPEILEIIIVDWTSDIPVADYLKDNGIDDPKIKIVRVEGEDRWILSYAFNIGFQVARFDKIIKVDADIVLSKEFFQNVELSDSTYIAGDWRLAEKGQEFINGFFYVSRKNLLAINGFNEQITTYGWDDDDLYTRLSESGLKRISISSEHIHHLPHDDVARMGKVQTECTNAWEDLASGTRLEIQANRFITKLMPPWNSNMVLQPFMIEAHNANYLRIRRSCGAPHVVPDHIKAYSKYFAAMHLLSWRRGQRVFDLDQKHFDYLMTTKSQFNAISKLDIEVALVHPESIQQDSSKYLVIQFAQHLHNAHQPKLPAVLSRLVDYAKNHNLQIVFHDNSEEWLESYYPDISAFPVVPAWCDIGNVQVITAENLAAGLAENTKNACALELNENTLETLEAKPVLGTPQINMPRSKLYLDAQHGLGNRLRAMASGAVVAQQSDRELVVVWEPDHHCEARLTDLFEYDGAVIEKTFVPDAIQHGHVVYNYMEIEENAQKDALIDLDNANDIYARTAYVLNSPLSNWTAENQYLQGLNPVKTVRDIIASVRTPNDLSAHVRMVGAPGSDTASYDCRENWTDDGHQQINLWREKSHFSHFLKRIDALIKEGKVDRIFLAADQPETYKEFIAAYGDRLAYLPRELYDRSSEQLRYALADAFLLSSSPLLLGSTWSSFSELAMRLSPQGMAVEMSGKDF
jgi:glycosyltransferase involved in cell wall biosynthesis